MPAFKDFVEANPTADLSDGTAKFAMIDGDGENAEATLTAVAAAPAFVDTYQPLGSGDTVNDAIVAGLVADADSDTRGALNDHIVEVFNVAGYGAVGDGTTDDTDAIQDAIDAAFAAGGGEVILPVGVFVCDGITMKTNVTLKGGGQGSVIKHAAASANHLIELATDATACSLRDFAIDGNRSNQSATVNAIHFDNTAGSSSLLAGHHISGIQIENVKGTGIWLGEYIRESIIENCRTYFCDQYGMLLSASDSIVSNIICGQSGGHGIYIFAADGVMVSNIKSWYSGRLASGANGYGIYVRDGSNITLASPYSQENSGHGFVCWGASAPLKGLVITGAIADGDNRAAGSFGGISVQNVQGGRIGISVQKFTGAAGTPTFAVSLTASAVNCLIDAAWSDVSGTPVIGDALPNNRVRSAVGRIYEAPPSYATGSLPLASDAEVGAWVWDSTLGQPVWSDGTNWVTW